jgi:hypothetical protein
VQKEIKVRFDENAAVFNIRTEASIFIGFLIKLLQSGGEHNDDTVEYLQKYLKSEHCRAVPFITVFISKNEIELEMSDGDVIDDILEGV